MLLLRNCVSSPLLWTNSESPPVANTQNMLRNMIWHTRIISLSPWASDQARLTRRHRWRRGGLVRKGFSLSSPLSDKLEEEEPNMGMVEGCWGCCLKHRSPSDCGNRRRRWMSAGVDSASEFCFSLGTFFSCQAAATT